MSREVRRVPLGWQHPTTFNEHWVFQQTRFDFERRQHVLRPASRLHSRTDRFVGLLDDYPGRYADWENDVREMRDKTGFSWTFAVEYHLTGYQGRDDSEPVVHPFYSFAEDGETEIETVVRDEDHLHKLEMAKVVGERPDPSHYMPVFTEADGPLGWCLYETVSEGTPTTPVFATAEALIDHLATVGQDYDQVPMRRSAAEQLVGAGGSIGSFLVANGKFYNSTTDADRIADEVTS